MLIRASLLQILFTVRSERQLCERIDYDLMFRWFVGLSMDDPMRHHSTFSKNREHLMASQIDELLFDAIKKQAYAKQLLSRDHFTVAGTFLEASASLKSFKPKDRPRKSPQGVVIARLIFMDKSAVTRPMSRQRMVIRVYSERGPVKRLSSLTWAIY